MRKIVLSDFSKNIIKLFSGSAGSQICWMLVMMLLTRIYAPGDFGTYQVFVSTGNIFLMVTMLRYEMAIILPKHNNDAFCVAVLSLGLGVIISSFSLIGAAFWSNLGLGNEILRESIYYLPAYLIVVSCYQVFYNWFVRLKEYSLISILLVIYPLAFAGCALLCYYLGISQLVLVKAVLGARLVQVLVMIACFLRGNEELCRGIKITDIMQAAKRYQDFPRYMIASGIVDNASQAAPVYFLQMFFGAELVGYYSITMQALGAPGALVAKTIGDVFRQRASWLFQHGEDCAAFYRKNMFLLMKLAGLLVVGVLLFAPFAYGLVFGQAWRMSGDLARLVLPGVACFLVASPLSMMYVIAEKQSKYFFIQLFCLLFRTAGLIFGGMVTGHFMLTVLFDSIIYACVGLWIILEGKALAKMNLL